MGENFENLKFDIERIVERKFEELENRLVTKFSQNIVSWQVENTQVKYYTDDERSDSDSEEVEEIEMVDFGPDIDELRILIKELDFKLDLLRTNIPSQIDPLKATVSDNYIKLCDDLTKMKGIITSTVNEALTEAN